MKYAIAALGAAALVLTAAACGGASAAASANATMCRDYRSWSSHMSSPTAEHLVAKQVLALHQATNPVKRDIARAPAKCAVA